MFSLADLRALSNSPGPVLTWYEPAGRAEFLGPQMAQWIAKTANYLGEISGEDDAWQLVFHLPASWRSLVWCVAANLCGFDSTSLGGQQLSDRDIAEVVGAADLLVSCDPQLLATAATDYPATVVLAQAMGPLALSWPGELPAGADDAIAEVSAQPDALVTSMAHSAGEPPAAGSMHPAAAVLVDPRQAQWQEVCLQAWRQGHRAVWVDPSMDLEAICSQEGIS